MLRGSSTVTFLTVPAIRASWGDLICEIYVCQVIEQGPAAGKNGNSAKALFLLQLGIENQNPGSVIGRPAGRRGADQKMHLFGDNAINSRYCIKYHRKPSRIQENS